MVDWKKFQTPVFILGCATVMYYSGGTMVYTPFSGASTHQTNSGWLVQACSLLLGAIGLISLATTLGNPRQKMDMFAVVQDASNPQQTSQIPMIVQEDSPSQGIGAQLISLTVVGALLYLFFLVVYAVLWGGGIYGTSSGWRGLEILMTWIYWGSILSFLAGLVALARPWSVLMSDGRGVNGRGVIYQQSVSAIQENVVQEPPAIVIQKSKD